MVHLNSGLISEIIGNALLSLLLLGLGALDFDPDSDSLGMGAFLVVGGSGAVCCGKNLTRVGLTNV